MADVERFINKQGVDVTKQLAAWQTNLINAGPILIDKLGIQLSPAHTSPLIPNSAIAAHVRAGFDYSSTDLDKLSTTLDQLGTTLITTQTVAVEIDGKLNQLEVFKASGGDGVDHMNQSLWIRDMAMGANDYLAAYRLTGNPVYVHKSQALYTSCLTLMTTPDQMEKFRGIIENKGNTNYINDPNNHPAIKQDVVNGVVVRAADWGHNQDAWQILASGLLDGLEGGELTLSQEILDFIGVIPAFLDAVDYTNRETKGSWEEVSARGRVSTLSWEWATLTQILKMRDQIALDIDYARVEKLVKQGAEALIDRFPYESAHLHGPNHPAYRELDATILYVGLSKTPELLEWAVASGYVDLDSTSLSSNSLFKAEHPANLKDWMYETMFTYANRLRDPKLHGFRRYFKDSYQATGFWPVRQYFVGSTNIQGLWIDEQFKDDAGIIHFEGRNGGMETLYKQFGLPSSDYEAVWNHPNNQATAIATRLAFTALSGGNDAEARKYGRIAFEYFHDALAMITGEEEITVAPNKKGEVGVIPMRSGIAPECRIRSIIKTEDGYKTISHPGPWGPLYWAAIGYSASIEGLKSFVRRLEASGYSGFKAFLETSKAPTGVAAN